MNYASKLEVGLMAAFRPLCASIRPTSTGRYWLGCELHYRQPVSEMRPRASFEGDHLAFNLGKFPNDVWFCGSG